MKRTPIFMAMMAVLVMAVSACRSHYEVAGIQRSRLLIDSRYDAPMDAQTDAFLSPYKHVVDSVMGPVVGRSARYMTAQRPEGTLSNLLADILVWAAKDYNEQPDLGIYNMGGVRVRLLMAMCSMWHLLRTRFLLLRFLARPCSNCWDRSLPLVERA